MEGTDMSAEEQAQFQKDAAALSGTNGNNGAGADGGNPTNNP